MREKNQKSIWMVFPILTAGIPTKLQLNIECKMPRVAKQMCYTKIKRLVIIVYNQIYANAIQMLKLSVTVRKYLYLFLKDFVFGKIHQFYCIQLF